MGSINKTSVREQLDSMRADFSRLDGGGNLSPEIRTLMNSMLLLLELIVSLFMEKRTKKTSKNSSIPASQSEADDTSRGNKYSDKKKDTKSKDECENRRTVETTERKKVSDCPECGTDLTAIDCTIETRTKIDITYEKQVIHQEVETKNCPCCGAVVKGSFSPDFHGPLQYGTGVKAFVINFLVVQMVAMKRVGTLLQAMFSITLSPATMLRYLEQLDTALAEWESEMKAKLLTMPCINVDETSMQVEEKKWWVHVYSAGGITLKFLHKKRGTEAINDIGILKVFTNVAMHDCWMSYFRYTTCKHAICGSHILRELQFVIDSNGYRWARILKKLLKKAAKEVATSEKKQLSAKRLQQFLRLYRLILNMGEKELPVEPPKPKGRRGRVAKSDAANLHERLMKYKDAMCMFAHNPDVPFTNNRAERDIRMGKVKQKVSGCFRAEKYATAYCRISSYLQTMKYHGIDPFVAIQRALKGNISTEL